MTAILSVVGGGLAGCEAAWQAAERGIDVILCEMRPVTMTPAHSTDQLAELVCSNSLGSRLIDRAAGLLKEELRRLGSIIVKAADATAVPAGGALAVDREAFAEMVTLHVQTHPRISVQRREVTQLQDRPVIVATGPLTSAALADEIRRVIGQDYLHFYDAMAPIVAADSIDMDTAFRGSRYGRGELAEGDYINCPLDETEYRAFVNAVVEAETLPLRGFESEDPRFFEACLPIEEIARRGVAALSFGPMRPVGLTNEHTGERPYAVVQLRQDNMASTLYNIVGFQTNLKWGDQDRVLRMIPGLKHADFARYGQMHRNTFINAPMVLEPTLEMRREVGLFFAGQITGVEGYVGSAGTGWLAGVNCARTLRGDPLIALPNETMLGALCNYVSRAEPSRFQPMKANFGLLPPLEPPVRRKRERQRAYSDRALEVLAETIDKDRVFA